ncbi:MAG: asparagine synthase (glutamine-hydrolyzing), partial [Anaerolineae bacterium]
HRGPDDQGAFVHGHIGLGNTRLAVIDLSPHGHQPMANEDESVWIVYNGEIYNFPQLRQHLAKKGHRFRSNSDTETIIHLYEEHGQECVKHLRGMFAFAIWDDRTRRLLLARDRVGKKPLFYYHDQGQFIFASEIKAILEHPAVPRRVNLGAVPLYLTYGYVPAPQTMFEGIYSLLPGHMMIVKEGRIETKQYWDVTYPAGELPILAEEDYTGKLLDLLKEAVAARLISDVPLGAFLSGGIDSTAIVAVMSQLMDQPVRTFAIGFSGEPSFNELEYAGQAAKYYGTDHREFVVKPDAIELLPKLVWHYDQPFADSSAVPTYLVSQLTREHVTVALSGDGGDELFAGYERFAAARLAERYQRVPQFLQRAISELLRRLPESTSYRGLVRRARRFTASASLPLLDRYLGWAGIFSADLQDLLLSNGSEVNTRQHFEDCLAAVRDLDPISQLLYLNTKTYLPEDLLVKADRMSMANSLEVRSPFLDQELLQFAAEIPVSLKLNGLTTKYILKKALRGLVPQEIIERPKHGFGVPVGRWFRTELKEYVRQVLLSPTALRRGYFEEESLKWLINQHQEGKRDFGHQLWTLLTFELWHQIFINGERD